jgi:DNA mismatch endonuclease (patch repair protein)
MKKLTRSENMSRIGRRGTRPEKALRQALWKEGLRYRIEPRIIGRPDLAFIKNRVAFFVDGCFWHGCPLHYSAPSTHEEFWAKKLRRNVEHDIEVNDALRNLGWHVIRLWQHDLNLISFIVPRVAYIVREVEPNEDYQAELATFQAELANKAASRKTTSPSWYYCGCGSNDVRILEVSGPGSLRANADRSPQEAECVCLRCRQVFRRELET